MNDLQTLYPAKEYNSFRALLGDVVSEYPENNAFIIKKDKNKNEYTYIKYKQFYSDIEKLGTALKNTLGATGKIAIISQNRYEWMLSYFTALIGGFMAVPLDKGLSQKEIESLLSRSGATCVIFGSEYEEMLHKISQNGNTSVSKYICMDDNTSFEKLSSYIEMGEKLLEEGKRDFLDTETNPEEPSIMLFTSGTTSRSKAVMLCQRNLLSNIYGMCRCQKFYSTDVNMAFLPFHHTFGSMAVIMFLAHGATNVFCDGIRYVSQNLQEYGVTVFVCVPLIIESIYKKIMQTVKKQGKEKKLQLGLKISSILLKCGIDVRRKLFSDIHAALGGKMRYVISGASAIDPAVPKAFNAFGITTVQGYGLTETSPVLAAENPKIIREGSVGLPLCNVKARICDADERGIGEIVVKGPNVMLGYYEDEEATASVLKDGWFYTGDLGKMDKDGVIYITGRKKNVIVLKNGKNVYPEEIETVINALPYVDESIVYGTPKGTDDLIISVNVVYNEDYFKGKTPEEIEEVVRGGIAQVNANMAKHQYIKIINVTNVPMEKTTTAKIKRYTVTPK